MQLFKIAGAFAVAALTLAGCGGKPERSGKVGAEPREPSPHARPAGPASRPVERPSPPPLRLPDVEERHVKCELQAKQFPGADGARFVATCPAGCLTVGSVWGTDVYTDDSALCRALIHAGAIGPGGGRALVTFVRGQLAYRGTTRHGVDSKAYGKWKRSFYALRLHPGGKPLGVPPRATGKGEAYLDCRHTAAVLAGPAGATFSIRCPKGCDGGAVWGENPYTADSRICRAAIHAGLATAAGGRFTVTIVPGQEKFGGSERHGVASAAYGRYDRAFRVTRSEAPRALTSE